MTLVLASFSFSTGVVCVLQLAISLTLGYFSFSFSTGVGCVLQLVVSSTLGFSFFLFFYRYWLHGGVDDQLDVAVVAGRQAETVIVVVYFKEFVVSGNQCETIDLWIRLFVCF